MVSRRTFLAQTTGVVAGMAAVRSAFATAPTAITVYKSSTCECCAKWVDHIKANGFAPSVHDEEDMTSLKDDMGVPQGVRSCHTALVDRYLIEGHVPAADIRRLLAERPKVAGLAVPGMPASSPGMAMPGAPVVPYEVVAFTTSGATSVYAKH
ncbi:MAG TPA: DUF411 domain-containing protein [Gemmatimonadales bacterium]|jgi:hypothetical protein